MKSITRAGRLAIASLTLVLLAACAGQKEPAQKLISDIEATVTAASAEAAKYVPDQLIAVQSKLGDLKAAYGRQDYAAVVKGAPAVLESAQTLATAAAAKKDEVLKALNDQWTGLAATVPGYFPAIQKRMAFLSKKSNKKAAAGSISRRQMPRSPMPPRSGPRHRPRSPRATWTRRCPPPRT